MTLSDEGEGHGSRGGGGGHEQDGEEEEAGGRVLFRDPPAVAHPPVRNQTSLPTSGGVSGTMVEKIRESYQRHSRNVSAVSDISVCAAEPLKRDENAEIRCILLCDSEVERNCVFEAVAKVLADGESAIGSVYLMQHHWEQPHSAAADNGGPDDKLCVRIPPGGGATSSAVLPFRSDGYFRFALRGTVFRLMLLSKDRQNLLKIYSFDFLLVGMQVTNTHGLLDQRIWEFEWKRLNRHSKKAVAPIILLGYFRDVLKLGLGGSGGSGDISLRRTLEESKQAVKKIGKAHQAIPRFCNLCTETSTQLEALFSDVEDLYREPGFVLQQCAYVNNQAHFFKIVENPNLTEEDITYRCDKTGDNPIMIAAKLRHKDLVSSVLRCPKFLSADGGDLLRNVIHARNQTGQTLLAMVALQGKKGYP